MNDWCDTLWFTSQSKHKQMLNDAANARLAALATENQRETHAEALNLVARAFDAVRRVFARLSNRQTARVSGSSTGFLF